MNRSPSNAICSNARPRRSALLPAAAPASFAASFLCAWTLAADTASDAYLQAHACLISNRFEEAASFFDIATATTNEAMAAAACLGRGEALFGAKRWEAAIAAYAKVITLYPESTLAPKALCARGFAEVRADKLPAALATFQDLAARFPDHPLAATAAASTGTLSRTLLARDRQKAEEALAREIAAINTRVRAEEFGDAASAAERFLAAHPDAANLDAVCLLAADCAFRAKNYSRAHDAYRRFLSLYPAHTQASRAWLELGKALHALSRFSEAADAFARAKGVALAATLQADCLYKAGRQEEALNLLETLSQNATNKIEQARIALAMGDCYAARQKWPEAERLYLSVETLHASEALRPVALDRLAGLYESAGQTNQAARARAELRRRFPNWK